MYHQKLTRVTAGVANAIAPILDGGFLRSATAAYRDRASSLNSDLPYETRFTGNVFMVRDNPLRKKLQAGQTTFGMWVTLESPNVLEAAVTLGIDWVVIEMEHGHLDWRDVINHLRVVSGTSTAAIVRVAELRRETIQRALDLGADGIIVPMIGTADELEKAFVFGRYPPRGVRGVAGERCVKWGLETGPYLQAANDETLIIPLLESRTAVENTESILRVLGLEAIFFGPADMSASYGHLGEWEGGPVADSIRMIREKAASRNIARGILARTLDEAVTRRAEGFNMIALGADINLMIASLRRVLEALSDSTPQPEPGRHD